MGTLTEKELLLKKVEEKVKKAIFDYGLIQNGDRILIGLSGGKDSLALMELLGRRSRIFNPRFELVVAHIKMTNIPYHSDLDYLRQKAEEFGLELVVRETSFDASTDKRKAPCFLCSWMRRKALFDLSKEYHCNKIALGHHQDDIIETLLMNMIHQGAFGTMPPRLKMNKFDMEIIRPLCLVEEKDIIRLAALQEYRKQIKNCPYEKESNRSSVKELFAQMEAINPEARYSIWKSMSNIQEDYLPRQLQQTTKRNK